jgi:hypothetical protein
MAPEPKVDPKKPHAFVERANLPFNAPKPATGGATAMEVPVQRTSAPPECSVCGKRRSDRLHEAAEAESETWRWPSD